MQCVTSAGVTLSGSSAPYLATLLATEIVVQGLGRFAFHDPSVALGLVQIAIYLVGVVASVALWLAYRPRTSAPSAFRAFLGIALLAWLLAFLHALGSSDGVTANSLTIPFLLAMLWLKPPAPGDGAAIIDVTAWVFIGVAAVALVAEVLGVSSSWYGPTQGGRDLAAFDRSYYWVPLADLLGLDGRWAGPSRIPTTRGPSRASSWWLPCRVMRLPVGLSGQRLPHAHPCVQPDVPHRRSRVRSRGGCRPG